jgi:RpiR family transcriptional regulator, carbohydrate utilization regulator
VRTTRAPAPHLARVMNRHALARLRSALPGLTPALARIAERALAAPEQLLALTITELAEQSGGSESAVIRLCRELGFDGFQDFKLALATEMAEAQNRNASAEADFVTQLAENGATALSDTARLLDRKAVSEAVEMLLAARAIHLYGAGASGITCGYLAYKLVRLGLIAHHHVDAHLSAMASATAGPEAVFVIVSSTGSTIDAVTLAEGARKRGARIVVITNRAKSPLVSLASVALMAASPETPLTGGAYASKISQLLIVDALFAGLSAARPDLSKAVADTAAIVAERSY